MRIGIAPHRRRYLVSAISVSPAAALLMLLYSYTYLKSGPPQGWILAGAMIVLLLLAFGISRWIVYAGIACGLAAIIGWHVIVDAQGRQDAASDRDDAAEIAASAVLAGENPWNRRSALDLPITTGPSSILLALPVVAWTGKIDALTVAFWLVFVAGLVWADVRMTNNSFLTAALLLLFPWFGWLHTLHWGLDELYYAAILSPLLWFALARKRYGWAGLFGGFMVLSRLSYAPAVLSAGLWWLLKERRTFKDALRIGMGFVAYVTAALLLAWWLGGGDFLHHNFWLNSQKTGLQNHDNVVTAIVSALLGALPDSTWASAAVVGLLTVLAALAMRRQEHPFYHMAVALVLAHTISFSPRFPMDYQLIFLVPALYGFAFSANSFSNPQILAENRTPFPPSPAGGERKPVLSGEGPR